MVSNITQIYNILHQYLYLLPEKCIYYEDKRMLIVADLHFGKVGHFRKNGIAMPASVQFKDLDTLSLLIEKYKIEQVLILGDCFHSDYNSDWHYFEAWLAIHKKVKFTLVLGNHDVYSVNFVPAAIVCVNEPFEMPPFLFSHFPIDSDKINDNQYNLCGHLHPAVTLTGKGRQKMRLPCFYFQKKIGVLPAFGTFTGMTEVAVKAGEQIFVVAGTKVIPISTL
jgi:DNA ligase-associated metallophosphoesterase